MSSKPKYVSAVAVVGLAVMTVGILWWEGYSAIPRTVRYVNSDFGFSLEVPRQWLGKFRTSTPASYQRVEFLSVLQSSEPVLMFTVFVINKDARVSSVEGQSPVVRELGKKDNEVYYAKWVTGNPYQNKRAYEYFRMMQGVPSVLDSFKLLSKAEMVVSESASQVCHSVPLFYEYPAEDDFSGPVAPVDLMSFPGAREFRTALSKAQVRGPNFAGRYVVSSWGCGTSCQQYAITDAASGRIVSFGLGASYGTDFNLNSRLIVFNPPESVREATELPADTKAAYYELADNGILRPICSLPVTAGDSADEGGRLCIQEITSARNPNTGEEKDFPTPCDVPKGWLVLPPQPL